MTVADLSSVAARRLRITLIATVILAAAGFVSGILVNRLLGPEGRGELAAMQTAPLLLATVGAVGMAEALVYHAARRADRSRSLLSAALGVAAVGSAAAIAAGWLLLPFVLRAQSDETLRVARLYLLAMPLLVLLLVAPGVLRARGDFVAWNVWRITSGLLWTGVVVGATVASRSSASLLLYAHAGLLAAAALPMLVAVYRGARGPVTPSRDDVRSLLSFGVPTAGNTIPQLLNLRLDQFLISATRSSTQLGMYAAAVNWCIGITLVMDACGFVLFPSLASIVDPKERLDRFAQSARLGLALAIALAVATAALTPLLFTTLFGEEFRGGIGVALVLSAANGALGYARVLGEGVRGLGEPAIALVGEVCGLIVMAVALGVLLPAFGITGAALGSLLGYSTIAAAIIVRIKQRFGLSSAHLLVVRPSELGRAVGALRSRRA